MPLRSYAYPLYYPQSISGYEKVKIITTTQTNTMETEPPISRRIVIFGATGDLCKKKLIPALFELWKKKLLPENILIVGASRRDLPKETWLEKLGDYPQEFTTWLDFVACDLDCQESLSKLHDDSADTTYFLSVPPERYENAIINLKEAGFLDDPDHSRVVIEKPFGYDLESARSLQSVVERHLREKQVFRIDHYLGKDTVNNILATRFGNILLEPLWNREYISEVQIFATETIGCEGRSQYYEGAGVVRDMLQNHMLQVLSLIAMDAPCRMNTRRFVERRLRFFLQPDLVRNLSRDNMKDIHLRRVSSPNSGTQTFVTGDIYIDNWRWQGVPFYFMTGKKMPYQCVEVIIKLKAPPVGLFEGETPGRIVMRLQPHAHDIQIDVKSPGMSEEVELATSPIVIPIGWVSMVMKNFYMMH